MIPLLTRLNHDLLASFQVVQAVAVQEELLWRLSEKHPLCRTVVSWNLSYTVSTDVGTERWHRLFLLVRCGLCWQSPALRQPGAKFLLPYFQFF